MFPHQRPPHGFPQDQHDRLRPGRRSFLLRGLALAAGLTASLSLPSKSFCAAVATLSGGRDAASNELRPLSGAVRSWPEDLLLLGRVRTCSRPSSSVAGLYEDGAVLVRRGRIAEVGPRAAVTAPENAAVLDLGGATLMPGIIDAHVHFAASAEVRRGLLERGVTSVGDVGCGVDDLDGLAASHDSGGALLAGVYGTGPMFGPPGGYPERVWPGRLGLAVANGRDARAAAESLLERGASMLKIGFEPGPQGNWPVLDIGAARAVVRTAHERGVVVRCHVQDLACLDLAVDAGVDCVEHTVLRWPGGSGGGELFTGERGRLTPGPGYAEKLRRLAGEGVLLVPTLQMAARADWDGSGGIGALRLFREAGGTACLGTDAPMRGVAHGMPLEELRLMALAGLDNEAALHAATRGAALALGLSSQVGSLEPGMQADLIAVREDPVRNLDALAHVALVMKGGQIVTDMTSSA